MEYVNCNEVHKLLGITTRRIQQMCKNGDINGATKKGKIWYIPKSELSNINSKSSQIRKKPLPIGISDFKKIIKDYYYVDKTLLIKDFIDSKSEVTLFTRPRRFGKTLNMEMIKTFFEKTENDTSIYFKDKLIWTCKEEYTSYQGKYPIIFLSFKDIKCSNWEQTFDKIKKLITLEFLRHYELEESSFLSSYEKALYTKYVNESATQTDYELSLQFLSLMLNKHYNEKVIIIIDEYDTPVEQGYTHGFYDSVVSFIRNFFSGGLKDNNNLAYGFLTGILKATEESIFSGLNNVKICSILDNNYSKYFGFTKDEVKEMLKYYNLADKYNEICEWYDGYLFGNTEIFNPWSVINYIDNNCEPKAFWVSTGSNDLIGEIIKSASIDTLKNLYNLLSNTSITTYIDTNVIYPDIHKSPYTIYSFLLVTGYLKINKSYKNDGYENLYDISIPNKEIAYVYQKEVINRFDYANTAILIEKSLLSQDFKMLQKTLEDFITNSISFFDTSNESFYHGMMLGLCAILNNKYFCKSNGESGLGRFDIELMPKKNNLPGFIFEFTHTKNNSDDLSILCDDAIKQIEIKKYDTNMVNHGISNIIKIGIAFCGKKVLIKKA